MFFIFSIQSSKPYCTFSLSLSLPPSLCLSVSSLFYSTYLLLSGNSYYPPPMKSGKGYCIGIVRPSEIVSGLSLENYWLHFNDSLWEAPLLRGDAHVVGVTRFDQ